MPVDLKTLPDDSSMPSTALLFGADSRAATSPSTYSVAATVNNPSHVLGMQGTQFGRVPVSALHENVGVLKLTGLTSDPPNAAGGWLYYNSAVNRLRFFNGFAWEDVTGYVPPLPLVATDLRVVTWVDPRVTWAAQPAPVAGGFGGRDIIVQVNPSWSVSASYVPGVSGNLISHIPEPGIVSNGITVLSRVVDPADATKRAILHRVHPSAATLGGTARSAYLNPSALPYNQTFWTAFAVRWSGWPGRFTTIWDIHDNTWDPGPTGSPTPETQSPIQFQIDTDGRYFFQLTGYYEGMVHPASTRTFSPDSDPISANASTPSDWHYFAVRWRLSRTLGGAPFVSVYRAVGSGSMSLYYELTGTPIGIWDTPANQLFSKLGLYQFDMPAVDTTMHSKGMFVWRDESGSPELTAAGLIALLRSI